MTHGFDWPFKTILHVSLEQSRHVQNQAAAAVDDNVPVENPALITEWDGYELALDVHGDRPNPPLPAVRHIAVARYE